MFSLFPQGLFGALLSLGWASLLCVFPDSNVQEAVWRDVAEILCLRFLFLFLLTPLMQARVLPAPAALGFLVLGHVWYFMLHKRWEGLGSDAPRTRVAVLVKHSSFLQADPSFPEPGVALALLNVLPVRCWKSRVGLGAD